MKLLSFSSRNVKEMLREPINLAFGLGFPVILILLLSLINKSIPPEAQDDVFSIQKLAPGIAVFGLSFITLFVALIISKDRETAFLQRLYTTPLKASDFVLGYVLPVIPVAILQCIITYILAVILGLEISVNILYALVGIIPVAIMYIMMGVLFGSILSVKAVGGVCGALMTNVSAWLSGVWFSLDLIGGAFKEVANLFPFSHAVEYSRLLIGGSSFSSMLPHLLWVLGYTVVISVVAIVLFLRQMKRQ